MLELYTSEGCSSCPPADTWLGTLQQDSRLWREFVPVAFHVDYWDSLGWPDPFASPKWTARQRTYAARWRSRRIYTPGFVLNGNEWRSKTIPRSSRTPVGNLRLEVKGAQVLVTFRPLAGRQRSYDVHVAQLGSGLASEVTAGENRGRTLNHDFVVLSLQKTSLPSGETQVNLPSLTPVSRPVGALAAWVTHAGSPVPIQAVGGWREP